MYSYASPKVIGLLGYDPDELIGKRPVDLMPSADAARVAATFADIVSARRSFSGLENINLHKDGRPIVLETSGVPILGADGGLLGYRGIDRDITERKRAEEALRETQSLLQAIMDNSLRSST